jgi:hypothetical protein
MMASFGSQVKLGIAWKLSKRSYTMELFVEAVSDEVKAQFVVTDLKPRARKHKLYRIEAPDQCEHTIPGNHTCIIGPIDHYRFLDGRTLVIDHAWGQRNAHIR